MVIYYCKPYHHLITSTSIPLKKDHRSTLYSSRVFHPYASSSTSQPMRVVSTVVFLFHVLVAPLEQKLQGERLRREDCIEMTRPVNRHARGLDQYEARDTDGCVIHRVSLARVARGCCAPPRSCMVRATEIFWYTIGHTTGFRG